MTKPLHLVVWGALLLTACAPRPPHEPRNPTEDKVNTQTVDPLGPKPQLAAPTPYRAPKPVIYKTAEGLEVWLVERPDLPILSLCLSLNVGAASDPPGKAGLHYISNSMLDEGAGSRNALEISSALDDLGAQLSGNTTTDGSRMGLTVLQKNLPQAFAIFADIVARPRFEESEWQRVTELWKNGLKRRADNPAAVAQIVTRSVLYGERSPYGHPVTGSEATAKVITLQDAKASYRDTWRPSRARLIVAGAISRSALSALITEHLSTWRDPEPGTEPSETGGDQAAPVAKRPKLVFVEQPGAPQSVVTIVGPGIKADDPASPLLDLVNTALGGSFTSRLNQNLREKHGWTYGASSGFTETRGVGAFLVRSSVFSKVTAQAVEQMHLELKKMREEGLTQDELSKVRARDLTDMIQTHETVQGLVGRLATLSALGMPPDADAKASDARQRSDKARLDALAEQHLDAGEMTVIIVGPAEVADQLDTLQLGKAERWSADGKPLDTP